MRFILIAFVLCASTYSVDAIDMSCDYVIGGRDYFMIGTIYYCEVETLSEITSPNQTITSIRGTHLSSAHSDATVKGIHLIRTTVNYFPHDIARFYPILELLRISLCHLKAIERVDVQNLTNLRELILSDNDLETLKSDLLVNNSALEYVNFSYNKLKSVGLNIFKSLTKLRYAEFEENLCIDDSAYSAAGLPRLISKLHEKCASEESSLDQDDSGRIENSKSTSDGEERQLLNEETVKQVERVAENM